MLREHRVLETIEFLPRFVTSAISKEVRELLAQINAELSNQNLKVVELGYDPEENEWHYYIFLIYDEFVRRSIRRVVEGYTNGKVLEFMKGKEVDRG